MSDELDREILEFIRQRAAEGNSYTHSRMIADEIDGNVNEISARLDELAERGRLEPWNPDSNARTTYRITLKEVA